MLKNLRMKNKGFTLVELMIVVAIIGILAAIAIPAFLKYIKSSKAAEANGIMKKMGEGAKTYFTSEQKYSASTGGDQPWHESSEDNPAGYPVEWEDYVFPGGASFNFNTSDGEGTGVNQSSAPSGGAKQAPSSPDESGEEKYKATTIKLNLSLEDPLYFQYAYVHGAGTGKDATATVTATANFKPESTNAHTVTQEIHINEDTQEVKVDPTILSYEFE